VNGEPDVRDRTLADPRHEIEAHCRRDGQHADQQKEIFEPARDVAHGTRALSEAFVDDQLEGEGDAGSRADRDKQGDGRNRDVDGIAKSESPYHPEVLD
jgi:hypothetical protein